MSKIEKVVVGIIIVLMMGMTGMSYYGYVQFKEAGGWEAIFIEHGKTLKRIDKAIDEYEPEK